MISSSVMYGIVDYVTVIMLTNFLFSAATEIQQSPPDIIFPLNAVQIYAHVHRGSYFGYSVASYVGQARSFCLVGAPRARYEILDETFSEGTSEPTGQVYRLELDPTLPYCSVVPIATTDELRAEYGTPTPGISSWLGGSVSAASNSLNGIQLGCDPRYIYMPSLINQSLFEASYPDGQIRGTVQPRTYLGTGQCALYTGASLGYISVDACLSQEEGACLSGFSSDVQAGGEFGESLVALGMPGSYLTEGNVFLGHYRGRDMVNAMRLKSSPEDLKHKGFNLGFAVHLDRLMRKPQGTGVKNEKTQGDLDNMNLIVSSSVWFENDYRGIVMLLDRTLDLDGIKYLKDRWGHIGNFFGYSLTTADLDGNGIADIIVGAPYYTERKMDQKTAGEEPALKSARSSHTRDVKEEIDGESEQNWDKARDEKTWGDLLPDIGRAYVFYGIYMNSTEMLEESESNLEKLDYTSREPIALTGLKIPRGRFAHAMVNLGDVDGDGTEDLAISCPYCSDPKGQKDRGAVFIYLGRKGVPINDEPFQVIWPGDLPKLSPRAVCGDWGTEKVDARTFRSFGWSVSGGTDLDGNHASDIVVGDYESDQIVVIRARNSIWFDSPKWDLPQVQTLPWSGPGQTACGQRCRFRVRLSVAVRGQFIHLVQSNSLKLRVLVDLDAEMENAVLKRLTGRNKVGQVANNQAALGVVETIVSIDRDNLVLDRLTILDFDAEPQSTRIRGFLWKPVRINASIYSVFDPMPGVTGKNIASWSLHPFLGHHFFVSDPLQFSNPACGPDNICHADLQIRMVDLSLGPTDNLIIYFRERISQRNLTVGIGNLGENAYAAQLKMTFPHQISFTIPEDLICQSTVLSEMKATQILCSLGDPLGYTGANLRPFVFHLNTAGAFRELEEPVNDEPNNAGLSKSMKSSQPDPGGSGRYSRFPTEPPGETHFSRVPRELVSQDSITITAEVLSGNEDNDLRDNKASITYKLQLAAKVELSSSSLDRTTIDSRNFTVQLYEMQRVHPETLGPEIKHIYLVTNDGPSPIENLWVNVTIPMQTQEGEHLVYFLDRIRYHSEDGGPPLVANVAPEVISAEGHVRGTCFTPEWALNPLRLNAVHRGPVESHRAKRSTWVGHEADGEVQQTEELVKISVADDDQSNGKYLGNASSGENYTTAKRTPRSILPSVRKRQQEIIRCGQELADLGQPVCATIRCRIDQLSRGDAVRIVLRGYVWADTFFRHKISDLAIVSEAHSRLESHAFGWPVQGNLTVQPLAISQNFVFHGIKIPLFREIPLWPIILGGLLGAALLTFIIIGMWKCGFFRRRRWYDASKTNSVSVVPTDL
ncbi:unnamed protein product [Calicophoron daubneyi]|uniref:Integrin alpha-2 domain-containing protein n=1 Tax=Calicophoron daubneyi TaxID=300641 RepID=A0AAV2T7F7_CALDB